MRRLNIKLLLTLIGVAAILVVSVHFLHAYQIGRNATLMLSQAEEARKNKDVKTAAARYRQYLNYKDDPQASEHYSELMADAADAPDPNFDDVREAYRVLDATVRRHPDLDKVRTRLVPLAMGMGQIPAAQRHIEFLQSRREARGEKRDPALDIKHVECLLYTGQDDKAKAILVKLIGFDEATGKCDPKALGAHETKAYVYLAGILRSRQSRAKLGEQVMAQLIANNPKSASAFLQRGRWTRAYGSESDGEKDIRRALELAPDDVDALLTVAEIEAGDKNFEEAHKLLVHAQAKHPQDPNVYRMRIKLAQIQNKNKEALELCREGLKALPRNRMLHRQLADVQLDLGDSKGVREAIKKMRDIKMELPILDFYEAQLLVVDGKWAPASQALERLRAQFQREPDMAFRIEFVLGQCYERLNQPDAQAEAFSRAMKLNPKALDARVGYAKAMLQLKKPVETEKMIGDIEQQVRNIGKEDRTPTVLNSLLQSALARQLRKPKAERDWSEVDEAHKELAKTLPRTEATVLASEVLAAKGELEAARKLLLDERRRDPKKLSVWLGLLRMIAREPATSEAAVAEQRARAYKLLDLAERNTGDFLILRLSRANALGREGGEKAARELPKLEKGLDKFTQEQRLDYLSRLGNIYLAIRDYEGARRCWQAVAKEKPNELNVRQSLFELAVQQNKEQPIRDALAEVERVSGTGSAYGKFCQAAFIAWQVRAKKLPMKSLVDARDLLDDARHLRPTWHEVPRLLGEIDLAERKYDDAIDHYKTAMKLGPVSQQTIERLTRLLFERGRKAEIRDLAPALEENASEPLKRLIGESLVETNPAAAVEQARADAAASPQESDRQLYLAYTLERTGGAEEAEKIYREVAKAHPEDPKAWSLLINLLGTTGKKDDLPAIIGRVRESVPKKDADAVVGRAYDALGKYEQAEAAFLEAVKSNPKDPSLQRDLAVSLIRRNKFDEAGKIIDKLLAGNERSQDLFVAWARRAKAQIVAQRGGTYRDLMSALRSLEAASPEGKMGPDDMLVAAQLLGTRQDLASRTRAVALLESLQGLRPLTFEEDLMLAQLLEASGRWSDARRKMLLLSGKSAGNPRYLAVYSQMMLKHGELKEAQSLIDQLERVRPDSDVVVQLKARLLAKDNPRKAAEYLEQRIPESFSSNPAVQQQQLQQIAVYAGLLEEMGMKERAGELLRRLRAAEPRATLMLAGHLARNGEMDEAFRLFKDARKSQSLDSIIRVALYALRQRPAREIHEYIKPVEEWIDALDDPQGSLKKLFMAHLRDAEERYPEAQRMYSELLAGKGLKDTIRAEAQNNLAYLMAVNPRGGDAGRALKLIEEAIAVMGPTADLLDTRAMVHLAAGNATAAVADMRAVVQDDQTPSKYFHLALAELGAGNRTEASESFKKAKELKLDVTQLAAFESEKYKQLNRELGGRRN